MPVAVGIDPGAFIGREPERLSLEERRRLWGNWVAIEIYCPERLPLRRFEAVGSDVTDCIRQLQRRGLDPARFEFTVWRTL